MTANKAKMSLVATVTAVAIALSGTFAWQSISQKVLNVARNESVPGGRLHDDFSGWGEDKTKDIYVENFGTQPIYARVRLDEYMEIGQGAGTMPGDPDYATKKVTVVNGKPGADINDMDTWSTHIPDSTLNPGTPQLPGGTTADQFHNYWTWVMGGQAEDNPNGETVYMPTFNKNKDSLMADVNGTWEGTDPEDELHYDDYHAYSDGETADGVRDAEAGQGAFYDCDDNTTDEGGPYGNGGVEGTNYEVKEETHTAKKTQPGKVLTMAEYKALPDEEKDTLEAWIYDADGWAYWSQPIQPNTATGLLLDRIILTKEPTDEWYYGINTVGQFITADDLGRGNSTGFYDPNGGAEPTEDALDLLDRIGVNTSSVEGAIAVTAQAGTPGETINYATPNMTIDLSAQVTVSGETDPDQNVTWELKGAKKSGTKLSGTTLTIDPDEPEDTVLTIVARSTVYDRLKGQLNLKVQNVTFTVDILDSTSNSVKGETVELLAGTSGNFTLQVTADPAGLNPVGSWTWESSNTGVATVENGTVTIADSAAVGATATITVSNSTYTPAPTASFTVEVRSLLPEDITPGSEDTTTIDGIEWYVLAKQMVTDTSGTVHNGALLLSKDVLENKPFDSANKSSKWQGSYIRSYLNGSWLSGKTTISDKAIEATISTRDAYNTTNEVQTTDKVFLLSEADVFGTSNNGADQSPQSWEYTITGKKLTIPNGGKASNWWWLRSPAYDANYVACVNSNGALDCSNRTSSGGVRPVFWYDLGEASVTFTPDILDGDSGSVKNQTVEIAKGQSAAFTLDITSDPAGVNPSGTWSWESSDTDVATVSDGTVTVLKSAAVGDTATITATNSNYTPALTASFTVKVKELTIDDIEPGSEDTVTIDDIEWYVLAKQTVNGHNAALLLSKNVLESKNFNRANASSKWTDSDIRTYLNDSWLTGKTTISDKAIEVTISTREAYNTTTQVDTTDKVFLLSEADVFGTSNYGSDKSPQSWEYTITGTKLTICATGGTNNYWWLRSPSRDATDVARVDGKGQLGCDHRYSSSGVRPAFWYNLDS